MMVILQLWEQIAAGNLPAQSALAAIIFAFLIYKIVGKYVEKIWFFLIGFLARALGFGKKKKPSVDQLVEALLQERCDHRQTRDMANKYILKSRAQKMDMLEKDAEILRLKSKLKDKNRNDPFAL